MSQIRIKNFGPIKSGFEENDGFMDIKKVTTFIGDQGTGKSSVAKLYSTLSWLEKSLYRDEISLEYFKHGNIFKHKFFAYQNLVDYFSKDTEIHYKGNIYNLHFKSGEIDIEETMKEQYFVPKIMYVPAERNLLSIINSPEKLKYLPRYLYTFIEEFVRSQQEMSENLTLPILDDTQFEYNKESKTPYIQGDNYKIKLSEASSGLQSLLPLFLVSRNLSLSVLNKKQDDTRKEISSEVQSKIRKEVEKIISDNTLSDDVKEAALKILSSKYQNTCFLNIVEEIEQNLFPTSQKILLFKLLEFANSIDSNQLILTTHSPYIINYLTLAIKGNAVLEKIKNTNNSKVLKERLEKVIPVSACVASEDTVVYTLMNNGTIKKLPTYEGMPSDDNYLNESLSDTNQAFDELLSIEEDANPELKLFL